MTKKDYELIADMLQNTEVLYRTKSAYQEACQQWAFRLMLTNPRFDRNRFLEACGVEPTLGQRQEKLKQNIETGLNRTFQEAKKPTNS